MPEEKRNVTPTFTADDWEETRKDIPREVAAARLIVSREIGGIPFRPYLRGDSDRAPVVKAVAGFAGKVYALLDAIGTGPGDEKHTPEIEAVRAAMEEFEI